MSMDQNQIDALGFQLAMAARQQAQPVSKAQELASLIVRSDVGSQLVNRQKAAAELRRLEAENAELRSTYETANLLGAEVINDRNAQIKRLEAESREKSLQYLSLLGECQDALSAKAELLEVLKQIEGIKFSNWSDGAMRKIAIEAIKKHGGTPKYETTAHVLKFEGEE